MSIPVFARLALSTTIINLLLLMSALLMQFLLHSIASQAVSKLQRIQNCLARHFWSMLVVVRTRDDVAVMKYIGKTNT